MRNAHWQKGSQRARNNLRRASESSSASCVQHRLREQRQCYEGSDHEDDYHWRHGIPLRPSSCECIGRRLVQRRNRHELAQQDGLSQPMPVAGDD